MMQELSIRQKIIDLCLEMNASGLNQGTSGNISVRHNDKMLITPSGIAYADLHPDDLASCNLSQEAPAWEGAFSPSTEWHFHRAILRSDQKYNAVVHTHSTFATVLAMSQMEIPACHYMVAAFGGSTVRCADYKTFGTPELSDSVLKAMQGRSACLMANHGMVVAGSSLDKTMWGAVELETLACQYYHSQLLGSTDILSDAEIAVVIEKFSRYGLQNKNTSTPSGVV